MTRPDTEEAAWVVEALSEARLKFRQGSASSVLDALTLTHPDHDWAKLLVQRTGVGVWTTAEIVQGLEVRPQASHVIGVFRQGGESCLVMSDPWDLRAVQVANQALGRTSRAYAADCATLEVLRKGCATSGDRGDSSGEGIPSSPVELIDRAIRTAWQSGASDVHFECDRKGLVVKLRLDGVMSEFARLTGVDLAEQAISRIKVLAQLDITERRLPQDGRMRFEMEPQLGLDLRVSIMPSVSGEDAVLRLLDKASLRGADQTISLTSLGFSGGAAARLRDLSTMPHGMLLVTGPTGSGKTTTLYAALSEINSGDEKIITIEDPVEYELPGVLQIPVNEKKGLSFAKGLRSILRHDPDRILVGEIRDPETASIAVQSALTGHLVFTTVHANSLFDVVGRFRHFGLDMFGFVSSLNGVVVQRLMRRLCPACRGWRAPAEDERTWLAGKGISLNELPVAQGCESCRQLGYKGRFVVAEVHLLNDQLRSRILAGADVAELKSMVFAPAAGVAPLAEQAARHVQSGVTTLEEVFRVVGRY